MRDSTIGTYRAELPPNQPICLAKAGPYATRVLVTDNVILGLTPADLSPSVTSSSFTNTVSGAVIILAPYQSLYAVAAIPPAVNVSVFVSDAVPIVEGRMRPTRFRSVIGNADSQPLTATADGGVPVLATLLAQTGVASVGLDLGGIQATAGDGGSITSSAFALGSGATAMILAPGQSISLLNSMVSTIESDMVYHCASRAQLLSRYQSTVLQPTATRPTVLVGTSSDVPLRIRLSFNNLDIVNDAFVFLSDDEGNLNDVSQGAAGRAAVMPVSPGVTSRVSLTFPLAPHQGLVARLASAALAPVELSVAVSEAVVDPSCYLLV